jgi:hypothetical protein
MSSQAEEDGGRKLTKRKVFLFRLLAVTLSVLCAVVILEVIIRVISPPAPPVVAYEDIALSHWKRYGEEKPSGTYRVVVVGDSITGGMSVEFEQTYHQVLESKLQTLVGTSHRYENVEVISLAGNGTELSNYHAAVRDIGLRFKPDLVIVGFCLNDFVPMTTTQERMPLYYKILQRTHHFLRQYSRLEHLVGERVRALTFSRGMLNQDEMYPDISYSWNTETDTFRRDWAAVQPHLRALKETVDSVNAPLLIAIFPYEFQLTKERLELYRAHGLRADSAALDGKPQAILQSLCDETGIECLDLLPGFRQRELESRDDLYIGISLGEGNMDFIHPNPNGHALAGELLFEWFLENSELTGLAVEEGQRGL